MKYFLGSTCKNLFGAISYKKLNYDASSMVVNKLTNESQASLFLFGSRNIDVIDYENGTLVLKRSSSKSSHLNKFLKINLTKWNIFRTNERSHI